MRSDGYGGPVSSPETSPGPVRVFPSGATRTADDHRYDPEGFLAPVVVERYAEFMHRHRQQADGMLRASDNWQKGMPLAAYAKGLWRHVLHFWLRHRGYQPHDPSAEPSIEDDLCSIIFNASGYLFELLRRQDAPTQEREPYSPFTS